MSLPAAIGSLFIIGKKRHLLITNLAKNSFLDHVYPSYGEVRKPWTLWFDLVLTFQLCSHQSDAKWSRKKSKQTLFLDHLPETTIRSFFLYKYWLLPCVFYVHLTFFICESEEKIRAKVRLKSEHGGLSIFMYTMQCNTIHLYSESLKTGSLFLTSNKAPCMSLKNSLVEVFLNNC